NDLQKHLRAECYSDQIRKQILDSTIHIENPKHRLAIQDILWRNKILFDPIPSTINIPPQSTIKTGDHPHIYSKQYPASHKHKDQDIKFQETQKLLERGQIEESTSPWSSPIVLVKKKDKTMQFCIDYRRLNAVTIKDAFPLSRINEIFYQLSDGIYYTKFDVKSDKCEIARTETDYLGHNIKHDEIRLSPNNVNGLLNTRLPETPDEAYKWNNYLNGVKFIWETDYKALTQLNQKVQINKRCERWRLKILEYDFKVKYIPSLTNSMPDYLSRSPVDDAEEEPDEISIFTSKSTQTDSDFINYHLSIVTAVQTRAMKFRNEVLNDTEDSTKVISDSLNTSIEENRIIPFSMEQLGQAQQNDSYAKNIPSNIKNSKNYTVKDDILMRRSNSSIHYVPQCDLRRTILHIYHDTAANGAHFGRNKTLHKIKQCHF
ncbi:unnamed protein product, partial [Rotaria magnacalcarata]